MIRLFTFSLLFLALTVSAQELDERVNNEAVSGADKPEDSKVNEPKPLKEDRGPVASSNGLSLDLDATSITGNRELPKVLYIVPWRKAELGDLAGRPIGSLLDEVIEPIDPEVFQRQLNYYQDATSDQDGTSSVNSDVLKSNEFADNSE